MVNWCATQHEETCFAAKIQKFHFFIENISFVLIAASRLLLSLKNSSLFFLFSFFNPFFLFSFFNPFFIFSSDLYGGDVAYG